MESIDDGEEMEEIEEIFTAGAARARQEKDAKDADAEGGEDSSADIRARHMEACIRKHAIADAVSRLLRAAVVLSAVHLFTSPNSFRATLPSTTEHQTLAQVPWWMSVFWVILADFSVQSLVALSISPWPTFPPQNRKLLLLLEAALRIKDIMLSLLQDVCALVLLLVMVPSIKAQMSKQVGYAVQA